MFRLTVLSACLACAMGMTVFMSQLNDDWEQWKSYHGKIYTDNEEEHRRGIWEENLQKITEHNIQHSLKKKSYSLEMNEFGDLTHEEFRTMMNGVKYDHNEKKNGSTFLRLSSEYFSLPDSVDWRKQGYVSEIKNQGQCGSCWAFSTTGSLEGQMFKKTGQLPDLSEQQLVDCSRSYGNNGCEGGLMDYAFQYIKDNHGLDSETCYPYEAEDESCTFRTSCVSGEDTGFVDVTSEDEEALKEAVATVGPISVAIDASQESFQFYSSGVYNEPYCSQTALDHGVLVVGYGSQDGEDYWIVKNSWGTSWGEEGYILMSRNKDNQCGIATSASYPLV